jgi:hypothetical protein
VTTLSFPSRKRVVSVFVPVVTPFLVRVDVLVVVVDPSLFVEVVSDDMESSVLHPIRDAARIMAKANRIGITPK